MYMLPQQNGKKKILCVPLCYSFARRAIEVTALSMNPLLKGETLPSCVKSYPFLIDKVDAEEM